MSELVSSPPGGLKKPSLPARLGLVLLGLTLALLLLELGARWLGPPFDPQADVLGRLHQCDRIVGWRGVPNLTDHLNPDGQYPHPIAWNSRGMHDTDHRRTPPEDVFRILVLGDSFVQASEVTEPETNHQVLEDTLNELALTGLRFEVISAGVLAWGPAQELAYFRTEGRAYQPDLVLVLWVPVNDLRNLLPDHTFTGSGVNCYAPYFVRCAGQFDPTPWFSAPGLAPTWQACSAFRKTVAGGLSYLYAHSRLYQRLGPLLSAQTQKIDYSSPYAPWVDTAGQDETLAEAYRLTADIYAQLAVEAGQIGAKTALAIVPFKQAVYFETNSAFRASLTAEIPALAGGDIRLPNRTFTALLTARHLPVLDLQPDFVTHYRASGEPLHWPDNFHWNVAGNRLVGQRLADWLATEQLIPLQEKPHIP